MEPLTEPNIRNQQRTIILPSTDHTATVIFLHGMGELSSDAARDLLPVARIPALSHIKWLFPQADQRTITAAGGVKLPAWLDIVSYEAPSELRDEQSLILAANTLSDLIVTESAELANRGDRIVVAGFSNGAALSIFTSLTQSLSVAGTVVFGGYIPLAIKLTQTLSSETNSREFAMRDPGRVLWLHGRNDQQLKESAIQAHLGAIGTALGVAPSEKLEGRFCVRWYDGVGHEIHESQKNDLATWLQRVLPKSVEGS